MYFSSRKTRKCDADEARIHHFKSVKTSLMILQIIATALDTVQYYSYKILPKLKSLNCISETICYTDDISYTLQDQVPDVYSRTYRIPCPNSPHQATTRDARFFLAGLLVLLALPITTLTPDSARHLCICARTSTLQTMNISCVVRHMEAVYKAGNVTQMRADSQKTPDLFIPIICIL